MRVHKHIQGKTTEEQILSIDGLIDTLSRRRGDSNQNNPLLIPCALFLTDSESATTFFTINGTIGHIAIDIEECEKETEAVLTLSCKNKSSTENVKVRKGITKLEEKIKIEAYTKVKVSFTLPVTNAVIGFTFNPGRDTDETETVSV